MKKYLVILLIVIGTVFCAFKKYEKPYIITKTGSITQENIQRTERYFITGQRINIGLIAPDGLKDNGVRFQLSKQDEKVTNWGFSIIQSKDLYLDKTQNLFKDYIIIYRPGKYILQYFYLNKKNHPFAHFEIYVRG